VFNLGENKVLLVVIGGAVLLTAGALFLTFRSYQKAEDGKRAIENTSRQIDESRAKKRKIPAMEQHVIILRSNIKEYVKILPEDKHIHNFINTINRFEREAGITMTKLDPPRKRSSKKKSKVAFDRIVYKINLAGSFKNILKFVNKFENYERFVAIENFQFRPQKRDREGGKTDITVSGNLQLETYVYLGRAGKTPVKIDRIVEKQEALQEQVIAQRNAIEVHRHRLDPVITDSRRDVFKDPRRAIVYAETGKTPPLERFRRQKQFVAWAKNELKAVQEMILAEENEPLIIRQMEIKKQIDERVSSLSNQLVNVRSDRRVTAGPLVQELERDVMEPLAIIVKERRISVKSGLTASDLKIILGKMEHFFRKGNLDQVVSQFEIVAKQIGSSNVDDEETKQLVQEIYALKNKAMVITEFAKRPIKISGIISLKGNPVVILNGRVFERGQMLDEEVKIHDVRPEEVEFIFREVRIIRRWE